MHKSQSSLIKVRDQRSRNVVISWEKLFSIPTIDQKLCLINSIINHGLNLIMPEQLIKIHDNDSPWVNNSLKRQKEFPSENVALFQLLRNEVSRERKPCLKCYNQTKPIN